MFDNDGFIVSAAVLVGLLTLLPLALGIGLVRLRISCGQKAHQLERTGQRVQGVVVDNQMESRAQGRVTSRPVVRFQTLAGVDTTTVVEQPSYRSHVIGTNVPIVYDPTRPAPGERDRSRFGGEWTHRDGRGRHRPESLRSGVLRRHQRVRLIAGSEPHGAPARVAPSQLSRR